MLQLELKFIYSYKIYVHSLPWTIHLTEYNDFLYTRQLLKDIL